MSRPRRHASARPAPVDHHRRDRADPLHLDQLDRPLLHGPAVVRRARLHRRLLEDPVDARRYRRRRRPARRCHRPGEPRDRAPQRAAVPVRHRRDRHRRAVPVGVPSVRAAREHRPRGDRRVLHGAVDVRGVGPIPAVAQRAGRSGSRRRSRSVTTWRTTCSRSRSSGRSSRGCSASSSRRCSSRPSRTCSTARSSPSRTACRIATSVKVHISALLAVLALLKAWAYRLDVFELVFSERGVVTGASYTDVNAQRKALTLLFWIAIVVAVIFIANVVRFRGWLLPGRRSGSGSSRPSRSVRSIPPSSSGSRSCPTSRRVSAVHRAEHQADAARIRYRRDRRRNGSRRRRGAERRRRGGQRRHDRQRPRVGPGAAASDLPAPRVDPGVLRLRRRRHRPLRDRRRAAQVMLSGREVDATKLPGAESWVNQKLSYTHGYGIARTRRTP